MSTRPFQRGLCLTAFAIALLGAGCGDAIVGGACAEGYVERDGECVLDDEAETPAPCPAGEEADAGTSEEPTGES